MSSILDRINKPEVKRFNQIFAMVTGHVIMVAVLALANMNFHSTKVGEFAFDILQLQALLVSMACAIAAYYIMSTRPDVEGEAKTTMGGEGENALLRIAFVVLMFELVVLQGQAVFSLSPEDFDVLDCVAAILAGLISPKLWKRAKAATPLSDD